MNNSLRENEILLSKAFSPTAPVDKLDLFSGRKEQIRKVIDAANQEGRHAIIYGERGVGKTSLSNILSDVLFFEDDTKVLSPRVNCDVGDDFSSIWHKVFSMITTVRPAVGFARESDSKKTSLSTVLPDNLSPQIVRSLLNNIPNSIIIIDEFDRILKKKVSTLFADCI